ncbi:MAG: YraN family protein [Tannerella sp.]|jgi:putative endonuclease|nr:YraN family protein [Tannerella sp.]
MDSKNETGKEGENVACSYLAINGYRILQTNWRFHHYELDIVATDGKELVVVEVKTRSADPLVSPALSINRDKIKRIVAAAEAYLIRYKVDMPIRFDVIFLTKNKDAYIMDEHIEDAFFAPVR